VSPTAESSGPSEPARRTPPDRRERVTGAITLWQRQLADVGGRNALLWYQDLPGGSLDLTTAHPGGVSKLLAGRPTRLSDLVREPAALAEARNRVRSIRARAAAVADERGLTIGFLAIGMATWELPGLARSPQSPVLLRTCDLRPTGPTATDFDIDLGEEVELNPALEHYLRSEQGLDVDGRALAEMATVTGGFDPYPVYAALSRVCASVPAFAVTPRLVASTFFHAKLDMVADLAGQGDHLVDHDVVAALAGDPDAELTVRSSTPHPDPDPDPDPAGERLVLDADSGQGLVVDAVRQGASLVVSAAPGTGATQTIANLVAALASEGKTVLLVAEQRSAITDAIGRLDRVGLGHLVLDAARAGVDRRQTLRRIVSALDEVAERASGRAAEKDDDDGKTAARLPSPDLERLKERRDRLRDHVNALHEVRQPWGVSAHEAQWAIAELGSRDPAPASRVRLDGQTLGQLSRSRLAELARELSDAAELGAWSMAEGTDPWYGAHVATEDDALRAGEIVTRLSVGGLDTIAQSLNGILAESSLPPAKGVSDWSTALRTMSGVRHTLEVFRPQIFDVPLDEHVAATATRARRAEPDDSLGTWSRSRVRREARRMLRPGRPPEDLHAELLAARRHRTAWQDLVGAGGRPEISPRLDEAEETFALLSSDLEWLGERLGPTAFGGDLTGIPMPVLEQRLRALAARVDRLAVLPQVVPVIEELRASGMGDVVDDFARRAVPGDQVTPELEHIWWVSLARHITDVDARYGEHDGTQLRRTVTDYVATDRRHLEATAGRVRATTDRAALGVASANRHLVANLRAQVSGAVRPESARSLFGQSAELFLAVHPCWAMSPLTVAEVVPHGQLFDVVVLDGASQVAPAEAITAISRGRQVVAFGDPRQAPPTGFATAVTESRARDDDASADVQPLPSAFDALAAVLPTRTLGWHYRSLDERLVSFANHRAYAGSLVTFPGTSTASPVSLDQVDGSAQVEPGQESAAPSTDAEVARIVELALEHALTRPDESLGVITLTPRHAKRVEEALDAALRPSGGRNELGAAVFFDAARREPFFVRSMHEAGGAVRDAVILGVGYGKTPHGRVIHNFPALGVPGAERMLTTATTRARRRLTVVASLTADDLDPDRLRSRGALLLRELLSQAARGGDDPETAPTAARDPLMADLAVRLRREGLLVTEDVGSSLHKVDVVITDPRDEARRLVAVEGDGAGYAGLRGTRERDRLWVEQLERLGWRHVRIFSTDLYRDPARQVARVLAATRQAMPPGVAVDGELERSEGLATATGEDEPADRRVGQGGADEPGLGVVEAADPAAPDETAGAKGKKRRRRGFRRSTPEQTLDDTDAGWGERVDDDAHDSWLHEQRPPHWD